MDGNLGKLIVSISTDAKELSTGLNAAQKQIQGFQQTANKVLGLIGFSLTAAALVDLGKKTIEYGETLNKMSEQTGLAASEIAKLKYVAEQSDTSLEAVTGTFRFLSRAMNEAKNGNVEAIQTFARFHVEFQNADGTLRNYKDVMLDVADRIKNTSNQSVVLAESQKLLGRNVAQVLPLFKEGADGIRRMTSEYESMQKKIGLTDTQINEFAKNSDALGDAWKDLSTAFQFMLIEVMTPLIPKLKDLTHWLIDQDWQSVADFVISIGDGFKALGDELIREVNLLIDMNNQLIILGETLGVGPLARFFGGLWGGGSVKAGLDEMGKGPPLSPHIGQGPGIPTVDLGSISVGGGQVGPQSGGQGIESTTTMYDSIKKKMTELKTTWGDINKQMGDLWGSTMEQISSKFGSSIADVIVDGKDFSTAMKEMWSDIAKSIIAEIVKIIAQQIILFAWQVTTGTVGSGNFMPGGGGKKLFGIFDKGGVTPHAREGLLYGANGFATTGNFGEGGMNAIVHPNEIISPIDKFFDAIQSLGQNQFNIYATGAAANDPQLLAELVGAEVDRRRRRP